jgi:hypothetical protein
LKFSWRPSLQVEHQAQGCIDAAQLVECQLARAFTEAVCSVSTRVIRPAISTSGRCAVLGEDREGSGGVIVGSKR